jgi:hypothetical protein
MPLLLFGCPLFARFLIPSQVKPVAVKRHRKRVRLKTDEGANDSKASVQDALAIHTTSNTSALWSTGLHWTSFTAAAFALLVAGIVATALSPATLAAQWKWTRICSQCSARIGRCLPIRMWWRC